MASNNPVTIDITTDTTESWEMTDSEGATYVVPNSRLGDGFIALNVPMQGSVRVENVSFGGHDMGPFALDDIMVEKLYIEIPGRGLGTP